MAYDEQSFLNGLAAGLSVTGGQEIGIGDSGWWRLRGGTLEIYCRCDIPDYNLRDNFPPWYSNRYYIKALRIFDCVTGIGTYAFFDFNHLGDVTIPDSVTKIGGYSFACHTQWGYGGERADVVIPDSVVYIGNAAFYAAYIKSVTIPGSLYNLNWSTFSECNGLKSAVIRDGLYGIGAWTFWECRNLETVTIPDSVGVIGYNAFQTCGSLKHVYYGGTEEQWSRIHVYAGNDALKRATIHYNSAGSNA